MKKLYFMVALAIVATACQKSDEPELKDPAMIYLSAGTQETNSRAFASDFPNYMNGNAQIAVLARLSNAADWTNLYIDHKAANVADGSNNDYNFAWTSGNTQYWPVNGEELTFMAYSPVSVGTARSIDLSLTLDATDNAKVPDVIAARTTDGTEPITGAKPANPSLITPVHFNFEHLLSQLDIILKTSHTAATDILSRVEVKVLKASAAKTYDLTAGQWDAAATEPATDPVYTYTYTSGLPLDVSTIHVTSARPLLLFPGTEGAIEVTIYVKKGNSDEALTPTIILNQALDSNTGAPAQLLAGKKTKLNITIKGTEITGLTGSVDAWTDLGVYGATVQ